MEVDGARVYLLQLSHAVCTVFGPVPLLPDVCVLVWRGTVCRTVLC